MSDLTTLANVKAWLGVSGTADDGLLERSITNVSAAVRQYVSRDLDQQVYTDARDGTGGCRMSFANYPVTAVASLSIDDVSIPARVSALGEGYVFSGSQLIVQGYRFTRGAQNVVVTYTAGYAAIPGDIAQACIEWIAFKYREKDRIGQQSKIIGTETVTFVVTDIPKAVVQMLNPYRRLIPV